MRKKDRLSHNPLEGSKGAGDESRAFALAADPRAPPRCPPYAGCPPCA